MTRDWISVAEAAAMLGYSEDYFRRTFCTQSKPLVPIRERRGKAGRRRILVLMSAIEKLIEGEMKEPA